MARHQFGSVADYVISVGDANAATLEPGVTVTAWNMAVGGTQHTDLLASDGATPIAGGELTTGDDGSIPEFYGPDGVAFVYLDANAGEGPRRRTVATDLSSDITSLDNALSAHAAAANPHLTGERDLSDLAYPSVAELIATTPFAIAHRGSGGEFPEHTVAAYRAAVAAGAPAIEVSVHVTADGVPVCFHDSTLDRVTDHTGPIMDWTYAALREKVRVTSNELLGTGWAGQPIPTLREVMNEFYGKVVIFLEAKSNQSVVPVQTMLDTFYPGAPYSVVWKAYYQATSFAWAKNPDRNYTTWGYVDAGTTDEQLDTYGTNIDMWGVPDGMSDSRIADVVARGKPVICWEVHRFAEATRLLGLGVDGLMESQWIYLNKALQMASPTASFLNSISPPGTLGAAHYDPAFAPKYDGTGGVYLNQTSGQSILMGGYKVPSGTAHTINFSMKWDTVPAGTIHSGIAFCKASDDKYQFNGTNASNGYHALIRGNGDIQIYRHTAGVTSGTQLGTMATVAPVNGAYMTFQLQVTSTQVIFKRTDVGPYTLTVTDNTQRGQFWHLTNGSVSSLTNKPTWKDISVS